MEMTRKEKVVKGLLLAVKGEEKLNQKKMLAIRRRSVFRNLCCKTRHAHEKENVEVFFCSLVQMPHVSFLETISFETSRFISCRVFFV